MELLILNGLMGLLLLVTYAIPVAPIRLAVGLLVMFFIPGYALISALFPRRLELRGVERVGLSIAMSIALVPLIGLAMNFSPWGIGLTPILLGVTALVSFLTAVALVRRSWTLPQERFAPKLSIAFWGGLRRWTSVEKAFLAIPVLVAMGVGVFLYILITAPAPTHLFTEFYLLDASGSTRDYPSKLEPGQDVTVTLGIVNREEKPLGYTIRAFLSGKEVGDWGSVSLKESEKWERVLTVEGQNLLLNSEEKEKLAFHLHKVPERGTPYETVFLWVEPTTGSG